MSDYLEGKAVRKVTQGLQVTTTATIPGATTDIFNVVGGRVIVKQITGIVTTEIGAGAGNARLLSDPTTLGAANLCNNLDIGGDVVGTMYGITGTVATAMQTGEAVLLAQVTPQIIPEGAIQFLTTAARDGEIQWEVQYTPIDDGAYIEAV